MLLMAYFMLIAVTKQHIYFSNLTQLHSLLTGMYYIGLQDAITAYLLCFKKIKITRRPRIHDSDP